MEIQVAIIILLVAIIVAALAIYLIATIQQLFKINAGLSVVLPLVGQIVFKTMPVNPVLDDINANLAATRDALENLMWKKGGADSPGIVESCFPGEGQRFLSRTRRTGRVVNVGEKYQRGADTLGSLLAAAAAITGGAGAAPAGGPAEVGPIPPANPDAAVRPLRLKSSRPWEG